MVTEQSNESVLTHQLYRGLFDLRCCSLRSWFTCLLFILICAFHAMHGSQRKKPKGAEMRRRDERERAKEMNDRFLCVSATNSSASAQAVHRENGISLWSPILSHLRQTLLNLRQSTRHHHCQELRSVHDEEQLPDVSFYFTVPVLCVLATGTGS